MYFQHAPDIWRDYPELSCGTLFAAGITKKARVEESVSRYAAVARARLADQPEGQFPEIQAWRRTFARMGLKPTQYRCAAESLLRRFKREGELPRLHPLVDLCNAASMAYATPIAVFDVDRVTDFLEVRHASGAEEYLTFAGDTEHPDAGEVIFADGAGRAHARRWTNRQSGYSAITDTTRSVLIVAEAMHAGADMPMLTATLAEEISQVWSAELRSGSVTSTAPRFEP